MTISLSNMFRHELPKREIKLKTIEWKETPREQEESASLEEVSSLIDQAKQELAELEEKKHTMLVETQELIEQDKANWKMEKEAWIEEAKKQGFQAGFQAGEETSMSQYQHLLNQANDIVDLVNVDYQKTMEQTEDVIIEVAIHTAEKILDEKLKEDPEQFLYIVKAALKEISDQPVVSIYLHPVNYEFVLAQKAELKRILGNDTKLSLYIDEGLKEDSCIIEHPFGRIDASVDTQLGEVRNALKDLNLEQDK